MLNDEKFAGDRSPRPPGAAAHDLDLRSNFEENLARSYHIGHIISYSLSHN